MPDPTKPFVSIGFFRFAAMQFLEFLLVVVPGLAGVVWMLFAKSYMDHVRESWTPQWATIPLVFLPPAASCFYMFLHQSREHVDVAAKLIRKQRYRRALAHLRHGWEDNKPEAARLLGDMCAHGWGREADPALAAAFYRRALEWQGVAMLDLGDIFGDSSLFDTFASNKKKGGLLSDLTSWYRAIWPTRWSRCAARTRNGISPSHKYTAG